MNFERIQEYLENAGYNIDGMHAEEIDGLAQAEGFTQDKNGIYKYYAA